jgi:hypothetical protein
VRVRRDTRARRRQFERRARPWSRCLSRAAADDALRSQARHTEGCDSCRRPGHLGLPPESAALR